MKTIFNPLLARIMMRLFPLSVITFLLVSCNENLEVGIGDGPPSVTTYSSAKCTYFGVVSGSSGACFLLEMYQSSNPTSGIAIMGYSTKPANFDNFKLDAGTYLLAANGAVRTYTVGMDNEGNVTGTRLFNTTSNKFTLVKSGSFTVDISGSTYTVSGNFTGMDSNTGAIVNQISVDFSGSISFVDESKIVQSTYTATGTPKWLTVSGPNTWTGTIKPATSNNGSEWITISNWGGEDIEVFCDYENNTYIIDNYSSTVHNDTYDGYFNVGYLKENGNLQILSQIDYVVKYDPITKILDFTGTVTDAGKEYEALVGIAAKNKTSDVYETVFSDFYAGVKLKLTPTR
ncbi:MAG: hypothetical protein LBE56_06055 [Tannerella sp.]|nr:hypothetical protein [Tannerella sp.]